ncbi:hypothetical protein HPP92_028713, partial [Vanilla planifolia]
MNNRASSSQVKESKQGRVRGMMEAGEAEVGPGCGKRAPQAGLNKITDKSRDYARKDLGSSPSVFCDCHYFRILDSLMMK